MPEQPDAERSDSPSRSTVHRLVARVGDLVARHDDEQVLTTEVAGALTEALTEGLELAPEVQVPDPDRYVMYPLHVAPDGRFSIAAAVWNVGQGTPVHGHETWGVVGIHSGHEFERAYVKPRGESGPLVVKAEQVWGPGEVTVCCTTDDDVHEVSCAGDIPVVGIHIYGADIGTLRRRSYDPETGDVSWFVSTWATPAESDGGSPHR